MSWKGINPSIGGMTTAMDAVMKRVPGHLRCSLDGARRIFVFSDYSGDSPSASYLVYSFLLADMARSQSAIDALIALRHGHSLGTRRMAYKGLGDAKKAAALTDFVAAARRVHGHVMTFAVAKSIQSLFHRVPNAESEERLGRMASKYKSGGQEHLARVLHFFAFALAGWSSPGQRVDWITDVDQIAPEQSWLADLVELAANLSSHYLTHDLGDFRLGTTRSDDGTLLLEDVCAIPDLFAGSVAECLSHQTVPPLTLPTGLITPLAPTVKHKAVKVLRLLTNDGPGPLRSTCICFEPDGQSWRIQARYFHEMPKF